MVPVSACSDDSGRLATASQLWPITRTPFVMLPGCEPWPEAWLPDPVLSWVTVAPSGGLKAKLPMDGRAKDTAVKDTWIAGFAAPFANTCTRNGTSCCASMAMRTWPISEPVSLGASTSW